MIAPAAGRVRARRTPWLWLMLVALGCAAPGVTIHAAEDPSPDATTTERDLQLEALLHKAEQQISAGHVIAPPDDSALETWSLVLQHQGANPDAPQTRQALSEFVATARGRANEEREAGRPTVSIDFTVFADLATQLLARPPDAAPNRSVTAPPGPPEARVETTPSAPPPTAAPAPVAEPPKPVQTAALPPPAPVVPAKPQPSGISPVQPLNPAMAEFYLRRGDDMLAKKDISAARKFYEFAANAGSARAAGALAHSYETSFLSQFGAVGLKPDPTAAKFWYSRAMALGDQQAGARLQALGTAAAK